MKSKIDINATEMRTIKNIRKDLISKQVSYIINMKSLKSPVFFPSDIDPNPRKTYTDPNP